MPSASRFWVPAALWAATIFVLSSIPARAFPATDLLSYDKVIHALVYSVLGALSFVAIQRTWPLKTIRVVFIAAAAALLYGMTDEFHQLFVPGRSAAWDDVVADGIGGLLGAALIAVLPLAKPRRA
jgi:VanZ family protein